MSSAVTKNRLRKRQAIFGAAAGRFATHGYHGTSMADIAGDLDLHKAALYHYFDSKEALLVELIRDGVGVGLESVTAIASSDTSPDTKVTEAVRSHLRTFHARANLYTIFNSEKLTAISQEAARFVDDLGRSYEDQWQEIIDEGISTGLFRPELDVGVTVKGFLGMLNMTLVWFEPDHPLSLDELADRYADLILAAVRNPIVAIEAG